MCLVELLSVRVVWVYKVSQQDRAGEIIHRIPWSVIVGECCSKGCVPERMVSEFLQMSGSGVEGWVPVCEMLEI